MRYNTPIFYIKVPVRTNRISLLVFLSRCLNKQYLNGIQVAASVMGDNEGLPSATTGTALPDSQWVISWFATIEW